MFQGRKELRLRNWENPPVDPLKMNALLLTHAHLDHSGYIPKMVKNGFKGPIYCSEATFDLCKILLLDSGYIQEEDAARANRYSYTKHKPALPLYTKQDAEDCLQYFKPVDFGQQHRLTVPFKSRKSWRGAVVIQPASENSKDTVDLPPHELRDLIRGIIWRDEHFNGMTIRDLAAREGHSEVFVGRLIHRTFETA